MKEALISVVTPTYNRAHTILNAIKTVQAQTYKNWEMIIVDDGSTDNTEEVIKSLNDPSIRYYKKQNGGPSRARNYGVEHAKGEWIMYLDSDDELLPECMSISMEWLNKYPQAVFAFPRSTRTLELYENGKLTKVVDDSGDTPEKFTIQDIFNRNAGFSPNGFMHLRRLFEEGIKWDDDLACMEDWELMMSIGEKNPEGFLYVPVVLQKYTQRYGSDNLVSQANYGTWADGFEYIYNKHKNDKMLKGQTWYPEKVNKWRQRQKEFEAGTRPAYKYHPFQ
ncbi:MAG: glycosyl transferase family 2 [Candidatus Saccharibacteria bacterium]|nr:glycosyl transferase family 2 [Candidatus Saccharibacteria bacterium]